MATCKPPVGTGKLWMIEYAIGCPDEAPKEEAVWKRLGGLIDKTVSSSGNLVDITTDTTVGDFVAQMVTTKSLDVSGNGIAMETGQDAENIKELYLHYVNPVATGGQPTAWVRITSPLITWTIPALFSSFNFSAPLNDPPTFDFELTQTASAIGNTIEATVA